MSTRRQSQADDEETPARAAKASAAGEYADLAAREAGLSRDARHSTWREATAEERPDDDNPPAGRMVVQERGTPEEA